MCRTFWEEASGEEDTETIVQLIKIAVSTIANL